VTPVGGFLSKGKKDAPVIVSFDANGRFPAGNDGEKGKCKGNSGSFALLRMTNFLDLRRGQKQVLRFAPNEQAHKPYGISRGLFWGLDVTRKASQDDGVFLVWEEEQSAWDDGILWVWGKAFRS